MPEADGAAEFVASSRILAGSHGGVMVSAVFSRTAWGVRCNVLNRNDLSLDEDEVAALIDAWRPFAALRHVARVAEALHQHVPGDTQRSGPQPVLSPYTVVECRNP